MPTPLNFTNAPVPYIVANNKPQKKPVYYVSFGLVTGPLGNSGTAINDQVLPNQYASGPIKNATKYRKRLLCNPSSMSNQIDPLTCNVTFSQMQFTLQDNGGEIEQMVTRYTMKNRLCTIWAGYQDIDEKDFIGFTGQVYNWTQTQDGTGFIFYVNGALTQLNQNILNGHTTLAQTFHVGDSVAYVTQVAGFARATDLFDGMGPRNYLVIDSSIYSYQGVGTDIIDGTVVWQYVSTSPNQPPPGIGTWQPELDYSVNNLVWNEGNVYKCVQSGVSGAGTTSYNGPVGEGLLMFYGLALQQPSGNGVTVDQNHSMGTNVDNYILYQGNFVTLMLQIMLSTGMDGYITDNTCAWNFVSVGGSASAWQPNTIYEEGDQVTNNGNTYTCVSPGLSATPAITGTSGPFGTGYNWSGTGTNYDVLPPGQGVGIPWQLVNISHMEQQQETFLPGFIGFQYFQTQMQAIKFFQQEFLQQCGIWLFENRQGQADCVFFYPPFGQIESVEIDDTILKGQPMFDANLPSGNQFVNDMGVLYDYHQAFTGGEDVYLSQLYVENSDSQVKYEEDSPLTVNADLFQTRLNGEALATRCAEVFLALYSDPPPQITAKMLYSAHLMNVGDTILLGSKYIPDYKTTVEDNAPQYCVCIQLQPNFGIGDVTGVFLGFGFNQKGRIGSFAPTSVPNYAEATAVQKNAYAFFCDDETGLMPNGDPPYLFGP